MKKQQKQELRDKTVAELTEQSAVLRRDIEIKRLENAAGKLENTSQLARMQDDLAVILTIKREKELAAEAVLATEAEEVTEAA